MSEDFTPPPRRPAPEELRQRIAVDLELASKRSGRRGRVLAPVAAALVLVAGVGGVLGAGRLDAHTDLVPVDRPSPSVTLSSTPSPSPTASPTASARPTAVPETLPSQPMTAAQIKRDTKSCLKVDPSDPDPSPRQGEMRTRLAVEQPVINSSGDDPDRRLLFLQDDLGQFECVDGVWNGWQRLSTPGVEPTAKVPGGEVPNTGGGSSANCGSGNDSQVESEVLLQVDPKRVAAARVTLFSNRRAVRVVDLPTDGPNLYVGVQFTGAAARLPMSFRVELRDAKDRVLDLQPYGPAGTKPAQKLSFPLRSCTEVEKDRASRQPRPLTRPSSDKAGVASCLKLVKANGEQALDLDRATAEVTISTATEWGAVLSDGRHSLGCSLFPTKEISAATAVASPATSAKLFFWATNPITPEGESLWAAGYLPGATKITYTLPRGEVVAATISADGYWMVKARTASSFDREDNTADWKPVRVTVTRNGTTTSYDIDWSVDTMCQQVSHGC